MRALLQRVTEAGVSVDGEVIAEIGAGLLILVCVEGGDSEDAAAFLARKTATLRIFDDSAGKMNRSVVDVGGAALVVSQFTLAGSLRKGNRPSFTNAENPDLAERLYLRVADQLRRAGLPVATGVFGAKMDVEMVNDGPVTFLITASAGHLT